MSDYFISSAKLMEIKGIPSIIFESNEADRLKELLTLFPLTILTVDVPLWSEMNLPPEIVIPPDASLRIEFSLDDIRPGILLYDMYIPADLRWQMMALNKKTRSLNIGIRDLQSGKVMAVPGRETPYILDWSGSGGLTYYLRSTLAQYGREWKKDNAYQVIAGLKSTMQEYGGYVTDLNSHIGLIYRAFAEFDKAKPHYVEEVKGARRKDGSFAMSASRGFNNLAVINKKEGDFQKALVSFRFALTLNPNYFEALTSIAGLIPDFDQASQFLGRAYRVRSEDPIWNTILHNFATAFEKTPEDVYDIIYAQAENADLEKPLYNIETMKQIMLV